MTIGIGVIQLYFPESGSLKNKRHDLKSVKDRVRNHFQITVAEVGNTELWQKATIAVALINQDKREVESFFQSILNFIDNLKRAEITDSHLETMPFSVED